MLRPDRRRSAASGRSKPGAGRHRRAGRRRDQEIAALIEKQVRGPAGSRSPGRPRVNMEKPAEFNAAVLDFLGTLPAPALTAGTNFYEKSLHFTNRGIAHWYAKEQGGLERLTGLTVDQIAA